MPTSRGILATCYANATAPCDPLAILRDAYAGERFVHVGEAPPETKWATGSNAAFLSARYDERTGTVVALAAIDNLGKGAAGQMIQCANLMLGLDEGAGLSNRSISMSVTAAQGFVASGVAAGIKAGAARCRVAGDRRRQAGADRRGLHHQQVPRAPGRGLSRAARRERRDGGRGGRQFGQRQCRHRRQGPRRRRGDVRRRRRRGRLRARRDAGLLDRADRLPPADAQDPERDPGAWARR